MLVTAMLARMRPNTRLMIFNCAQLISYCSRRFTLKPGDLIFTGTPEGVIAGYPPAKQVWLKPGDRPLRALSEGRRPDRRGRVHEMIGRDDLFRDPGPRPR